MATTTPTEPPIEGPATATVHQALGWVMRNTPFAGSCDHSQGGGVVEYLFETERLSEKLGWDFAVVAAHASAATEAFTSPAWKDGMNAIPGSTAESAPGGGGAVAFHIPQEAAAAHVAYLATRGAVAESMGAEGDEQSGLKELREAGYFDLVPASSGQAESAAMEPAATPALSQHLAGIRETAVAENEPVAANEAPPLPDLQWVDTNNFHPRLGGIQPVAICYHTTWDMSLQNVINHFRNPGSEASSTFVIDRDGTPYQMVSSRNAPWTNGDYRDVNTGAWNNPTTSIPWLTRAIDSCERGEHNLNDFFITYEFISTPDIPPTDAQYETAIQLSKYFCHPSVYGISPHRSHHMRHADINGVSRWYDPGNLFDLRRIVVALGGDPTRFSD